MALTPQAKKEIISKYGSSATDTGSPEAQVALLSKRIDEITEHLQTNKKDHHNRRGLLLMVGKRRRILQYLAKTDICLLYTSPSPRDRQKSRMPSSA